MIQLLGLIFVIYKLLAIIIIDDTRSVESLISAECQKLNFPVLRKQLCHPRFASGFQCMTSMTVKNKRHFNPSCSRLAIE